MHKTLKITAVSYLNTKPFLYGLLNSPLIDFLDIELAIPSESARKILDGSVDIGLVPVAILPDLDQYHIVSDYCIGAIDQVGTVNIFSEVPMDEIECIYLDYHSRTSVILVQVLMAQYFKKEVKFLHATPGYTRQISGRTAGLVIGDRAIDLYDRFDYSYDLASAWHQHTGKPFVFAVWISREPLDELVSGIFNEALKQGLSKINHLLKILPTFENGFDLHHYFTRQISYNFDIEKQNALKLFLSIYNEKFKKNNK